MNENYTFNHVIDTANSIFASWNLFPAESVDFIPFFDNLKNLIQDRVILSFFEKTGNEYKLLFHTFQDPYFEKYIDKEIVSFASTNSGLGIRLDSDTLLFAMGFNFGANAERLKLNMVELDSPDYRELKDLIDIVKAEYEQLIPVVASFVQNASVDRAGAYRQPIQRLIDQDMFTLDKNEYLDDIRDLISDCIVDIEDSLLIKTSIGDGYSITNLFAVVAYPAVVKRCEIFNYTAQILLTRKQIASISAWSTEQGHAAALEIPLSQTARSIADTPFCTGFVEYSGIAGHERDSAGSIQDSIRQSKEQELYAAITNTSEPNSQVVNFIPIFLNGCPWIVFYTLAKRESQSFKAWRHNYFIYRDVISKVGNSIRIKAKSRFFEIITKTFENAFLNSVDAVSYTREVNRKLRHLSCFFPFPVPKLNVKNNGSNATFFLNNVEFSVEILMNVTTTFRRKLTTHSGAN